jgi:hypothetical protein
MDTPTVREDSFLFQMVGRNCSTRLLQIGCNGTAMAFGVHDSSVPHVVGGDILEISQTFPLEQSERPRGAS